jgi:hypothetical protein
MTRTPRSIVSPIQAIALATSLLAGVLLGTVGPGMIPSASAASSFGVSNPLTTGQSLTSPSNSYFAIMQGDGNFVIYQRTLMGNIAVWSTGTSGTASDTLMLQGDGNLVLYGAGRAYWASYAFASSQLSVSLQDDGNLVVVSAGRPIWSWKTGAIAPPPPPPCPTPSSSSSVGCEQVLNEGQQLTAGPYTAVLQGDGNFVLYNGATTANNAMWSTGTNNTRGVLQLVLQHDGNLVLYTPGRASAPWSTGTFGKGATSPHLELQGDGNLVLYKSAGASPGSAIWATGLSNLIGVYAYQSQPANAALQDGWQIIGTTGALGSEVSPWVRSPNSVDRAAGQAIQDSGKSTPWMSYWTVSGPSASTNTGLSEGQSLSVGNYRVVLQCDGNLVVYQGNSALWSTGTGNGNTVCGGSFDQNLVLVMQGSDGNLVLYAPHNVPRWASGSHLSNASMILMCDGSLNVDSVEGARYPDHGWSDGVSRGCSASPSEFYNTGKTAGANVRNAINSYGLTIKPRFVILDAEGYPDSNSGLDAAGSAQWAEMIRGWADGITNMHTDSSLNPGFYSTMSDYVSYNLRSINVPFFVAVAFGANYGGIVPPQRLPGVDGANIQGVVAFYSGPSFSVQCATVRQAEASILSWGYRYNTLQFDGGQRCHS